MNNDYREVIEETEEEKATSADAESVSAGKDAGLNDIPENTEEITDNVVDEMDSDEDGSPDGTEASCAISVVARRASAARSFRCPEESISAASVCRRRWIRSRMRISPDLI